MTLFRKIARIFLLALWLPFTGLLAVAVQFQPKWGAVRRISRITRLWGKGFARIIGMDIRVFPNGHEIPDGAFLVSNHHGYLDVIAHASVFPVRFTPKAEVATWPLIGWYLALSRPIWIRRDSKLSSARTAREFADTVSNGVSLMIYPEGTTSDGRGDLLKFKSTVFEPAAAGPIRVWPVITIYRGHEPEKVGWFGSETLLPHFWGVLGLRRIDVEIHFLDPILPARGLTRKELARLLHDRMNAAHGLLKAGRVSG